MLIANYCCCPPRGLRTVFLDNYARAGFTLNQYDDSGLTQYDTVYEHPTDGVIPEIIDSIYYKNASQSPVLNVEPLQCSRIYNSSEDFPDLSKEWTIEAYVNVDFVIGQGPFMSVGSTNGASHDLIALRISPKLAGDPTGTFKFNLNVGANSGTATGGSILSSAYSLDEIHHYCTEKIGQIIYFYVDGNYEGQIDLGGNFDVSDYTDITFNQMTELNGIYSTRITFGYEGSAVYNASTDNFTPNTRPLLVLNTL